MLLVVTHYLWSIFDDSGLFVSSVLSSAVPLFSVHMFAGNLDRAPLPGARHTHGTKHPRIPGCHVIAFMRAYHPVRATHRVANSSRALVIHMILHQPAQQFAPIGFQRGLDVTVRLVASHLATQMVRDRDTLLIGAMKRLGNRDNLCFHGSDLWLRGWNGSSV